MSTDLQNIIEKAKFSNEGALSLLEPYNIIVD